MAARCPAAALSQIAIARAQAYFARRRTSENLAAIAQPLFPQWSKPKMDVWRRASKAAIPGLDRDRTPARISNRGWRRSRKRLGTCAVLVTPRGRLGGRKEMDPA